MTIGITGKNQTKSEKRQPKNSRNISALPREKHEYYPPLWPVHPTSRLLLYIITS
jgi:hypothetical protein